jgi:hypothetical protein
MTNEGYFFVLQGRAKIKQPRVPPKPDNESTLKKGGAGSNGFSLSGPV